MNRAATTMHKCLNQLREWKRNTRVGLLALGVISAAMAGDTQAGDDKPAFGRALMLTHSAGYEHDVVKRKGKELSLAARQLKTYAAEEYALDETKDCDTINAENLKNYDAVIFYTSGNLPIDKAGRKALVSFVREGGAFVGIHSASDTYKNKTWYGDLVGGVYNGHPWNTKVTAKVHCATHAATGHLPDQSWTFKDEIYQFRDLRVEKDEVLLSLSGKHVNRKRGKRDDGRYPLAWARSFGDGRVFYSALGHRASMWKKEQFLQHLLGGLRWAARDADVDAKPEQSAKVLFDGSGFDLCKRHGGGATLARE